MKWYFAITPAKVLNSPVSNISLVNRNIGHTSPDSGLTSANTNFFFRNILPIIKCTYMMVRVEFRKITLL